jgi:membrane-associated protease RseP (regulator of RpoE activity)
MTTRVVTCCGRLDSLSQPTNYRSTTYPLILAYSRSNTNAHLPGPSHTMVQRPASGGSGGSFAHKTALVQNHRAVECPLSKVNSADLSNTQLQGAPGIPITMCPGSIGTAHHGIMATICILHVCVHLFTCHLSQHSIIDELMTIPWRHGIIIVVAYTYRHLLLPSPASWEVHALGPHCHYLIALLPSWRGLGHSSIRVPPTRTKA